MLATWTGAVRRVDRTAAGVDRVAGGVPGYGTFETADGRYVALGVLTEDHFWRPLCTELGLDDVVELDFVARSGRLEELQPRLASVIRTRPRDDLVDALAQLGVPVAPVLDRDEMVQLEHLRSIGAVTSDPWADPATGFPVRFTRHPAKRVAPPPTLDEHHDVEWVPR